MGPIIVETHQTYTYIHALVKEVPSFQLWSSVLLQTVAWIPVLSREFNLPTAFASKRDKIWSWGLINLLVILECAIASNPPSSKAQRPFQYSIHDAPTCESTQICILNPSQICTTPVNFPGRIALKLGKITNWALEFKLKMFGSLHLGRLPMSSHSAMG